MHVIMIELVGLLLVVFIILPFSFIFFATAAFQLARASLGKCAYNTDSIHMRNEWNSQRNVYVVVVVVVVVATTAVFIHIHNTKQQNVKCEHFFHILLL